MWQFTASLNWSVSTDTGSSGIWTNPPPPLVSNPFPHYNSSLVKSDHVIGWLRIPPGHHTKHNLHISPDLHALPITHIRGSAILNTILEAPSRYNAWSPLTMAMCIIGLALCIPPPPRQQRVWPRARGSSVLTEAATDPEAGVNILKKNSFKSFLNLIS